MMWDSDMWREMERLRREMDGLFRSAGGPRVSADYPLVNVYDAPESIMVVAELPGLTKDKVNLSLSDGTLTISGAQEDPAGSGDMTAIRRERAAGAFEKSVRIPTKVEPDGISAKFVNGMLSVTLPKAEEVKPKTIAIEAK